MGESQEIAADAVLSAFNGSSQHKRLMRLDFPLRDGPPAVLLPNTLIFHEALSSSFRGVAELLSDDPRIPLKIVMGKMVTISLVREDGTLRYFNGYITEFCFLRSDGGFAVYQMVFEPWLAFTRLRKGCVSFHNKTVREITAETLQHYGQAEWNVRLTGDDPQLRELKTADDPKQLLFMLQTHSEGGRPFANVPYILYKNGSPVEEGISDDLGRIAIEHANGTQGYTVELANGDKFDLKAWEKFDSKDKALHREQLLSSEGARALDGTVEGRTYS